MGIALLGIYLIGCAAFTAVAVVMALDADKTEHQNRRAYLYAADVLSVALWPMVLLIMGAVALLRKLTR